MPPNTSARLSGVSIGLTSGPERCPVLNGVAVRIDSDGDGELIASDGVSDGIGS